MNNMDIMTGIQNLLLFINSNWTAIIIIVGLINALIIRIRNYMSKSQDEKVAIAKAQIKEIILKLCTEAEMDYLEWVSAGSIKRSQVIDEIFASYPVLSKITNQDEVIEWIDDMIDEALETMRDIFEENCDDHDETEEVIEE